MTELIEEQQVVLPPTDQCVLCDCPHSLQFCPKFLTMSLKRRQKIIKRFELCFNCLERTHTPAHCATFQTCERCGGLHHTLLHNPVPRPYQRMPSIRHRPVLMPRPGTRARSSAASMNREQRRMRHERNYAVGSYERNMHSGPTHLQPPKKRRISRSRSLLMTAMRALYQL